MIESSAAPIVLHKTGPVDTAASPFARWKTLPLGAVSFREGFWKARQTLNRKESLTHGFKMLEAAGNLDNFRIAVGLKKGNYRGYVFNDSDVYKWLEAVAWEMGGEMDAGVMAMADEAITLIEQAQCADGYLDTYYQIAKPDARWTDFDMGHEMYCAGHLIQAAVAFQRALGDERLLRVARRFADYLDAEFGPGKREEACGHPEIEMALVELFRATQEKNYLELAQFFVDQRGQKKRGVSGRFHPAYYQDHVPVRQADAVTGHAVRQLYLTNGVADLYLERGEQSLRDALERMWQDMVSTKLYITGGVGARHDGEAFGDAYELPSDEAYCETCAGIANWMWNWRMLLLSGEGRYADLMERVLYNNILGGVGQDGCHFFYTNPLFVQGKEYLRNVRAWDGVGSRATWYDCACCPPNVMRLVSSLAHYVATADASGVQIHLYNAADIHTVLPNAQEIALRVNTAYPWQGSVRIEIQEGGTKPWQLALRVPEWSENARVVVNGQPLKLDVEKGYVRMERNWSRGDVIDLDLAMTPRVIAPNPRVTTLRGMLALERGPLVYCLEDIDQANDDGTTDLQVDPNGAMEEEWQADLLGGVVVIHANGYALEQKIGTEHLYEPFHRVNTNDRHPIRLTAIPYFAWGNRDLDGMRVWIPQG